MGTLYDKVTTEVYKLDVSIILVNYNTKQLTINAINSIIEKTSSLLYEIIVVDNNSTDGSVDFINATFGKSVQIIGVKENFRGFKELTI